MPKLNLYALIKSGEIRVNPITSPPEYRFWNRVSKDGPIQPEYGQCWLWLGPPNHNGYGQFMVSYRVFRAHRYSYQIHVGVIPEGLDVLHRCDTPLCVNPAHLFVGTALDNQRDKVRKGRQARGESDGAAKLTEADVREMRRRYRLRLANPAYHDPINGQGALAREFGVTQANVSIIVRDEGWTHVSE